MWSHLSVLVNKKTKQFSGHLENAQLAMLWSGTVKEMYPEAPYYAEYQNIKNNHLFVKVNDTIWINELEANKNILLSKINQKRSHKIQNIHFSL